MNSSIPNIRVVQMTPSKGLNPDIMLNQYHYRKTGEFIGENAIDIAYMTEPIWWNRPLLEDADELVKLEPDGVYSYNFPLAVGLEKWKTNYNLLLNKHNFPTAIHLKFDHDITEEEFQVLSSMVYRSVRDTLIYFGVPEDEIVFINNDLLLHGKKFVGGEHILNGNVYEEDTLITFLFSEERDTFARLTGANAQALTKITGILDEFPGLCTKEQFLEVYVNNLYKYLKLL